VAEKEDPFDLTAPAAPKQVADSEPQYSQAAQQENTTVTREITLLKNKLPRSEADLVAITNSKSARPRTLRDKPLLTPRTKIDGWLMYATWVTTRDKSGDMIGRELHDVPEIYEFALRLPEHTSPRTEYQLCRRGQIRLAVFAVGWAVGKNQQRPRAKSGAGGTEGKDRNRRTGSEEPAKGLFTGYFWLRRLRVCDGTVR
jgi:hypothetical protein